MSRTRLPVTGPCADCGNTVTKRHQANRKFRCPDCSAAAAAKAAREMANHSGEAYDKWLRSAGAIRVSRAADRKC